MTTKTKDCLVYLVGVLCFFLFFDQIRAENKSDASSHWAFQPIRPISIPDHALEDPITWFIESKLEDIDLKLSSPAGRRDWVKRLYYKLTGLRLALMIYSLMQKTLEQTLSLLSTL